MSSSTSPPEEADILILGGGIAGSVLASRLHTELPNLSIVLIEAGEDVANHPLTSSALGCFACHYSDLDWAYTSVPQKHLGDRECYQAAGKALGGGSATNYGTWTRGARGDYDRWGEEWGYDALLPYFKKVETWFAKPDEQDGEQEWQHGHEGKIHVTTVAKSSPNRKYPLRDAVKGAWAQIGVEENVDGNSGDPLGCAPLVESWREGKRQMASEVYGLGGVRVLTGMMVQRVVVEESEGKKRAVGVEVLPSSATNGVERKDRTPMIIKARKQIILSTGAYRTPQILMLSGIGPATTLAHHDIPLQVENPHVGQNFHDHLAVCLWWRLRDPSAGLALGTPSWTDPAYSLGIPSDWLATQHFSPPTLPTALQADGASKEETKFILDEQTCHTETIIAYAPAGARLAGVDVPIDGSCIGSIILNLTPTSRGKVSIKSKSVLDPPVLDPNYYATETDRVILREAIRDAVRLMTETPELASVVEGEVPPDGFSPLSLESSDEEIDARVARVGNTFYHPGGSARLGSVVDGELRVKGVEGLRVVDASVFPVPVSGHYQSVVYAVAERAVEFVVNELGG